MGESTGTGWRIRVGEAGGGGVCVSQAICVQGTDGARNPVLSIVGLVALAVGRIDRPSQRVGIEDALLPAHNNVLKCYTHCVGN